MGVGSVSVGSVSVGAGWVWVGAVVCVGGRASEGMGSVVTEVDVSVGCCVVCEGWEDGLEVPAVDDGPMLSAGSVGRRSSRFNAPTMAKRSASVDARMHIKMSSFERFIEEPCPFSKGSYILHWATYICKYIPATI